MLLKAPYIVTMEGPVLKDHAIWVEGEKIVQIAPQKELSGKGNVIDLPNTILLPGLINCHCHLELSQLPEPLPADNECAVGEGGSVGGEGRGDGGKQDDADECGHSEPLSWIRHGLFCSGRAYP